MSCCGENADDSWDHAHFMTPVTEPEETVHDTAERQEPRGILHCLPNVHCKKNNSYCLLLLPSMFASGVVFVVGPNDLFLLLLCSTLFESTMKGAIGNRARYLIFSTGRLKKKMNKTFHLMRTLIDDLDRTRFLFGAINKLTWLHRADLLLCCCYWVVGLATAVERI